MLFAGDTAAPTITWCPGTNSNPLVVNCNANIAGPVSFLGAGGLLGPAFIYGFWHIGYTNHSVLDLGTETVATLVAPCNKVVLEVISENANSGMEIEAADEFGFSLSHEGPLAARSFPQTIVLTGKGIKTVRFKCPNGKGALANFYLLPQ